MNSRLEPVVQLLVRGPGQTELHVEMIIDTGFTGWLTLPVESATALGLVREWGGNAVMADGSVRQFDVHAAEVAWDGEWRPVLVSAVGFEPLIGMRLLSGCELRVKVVPGGTVKIISRP